MLVRDIMSSPVAAVSPDTTLEDCYRAMRERDIRHLVVRDGDRVLGVVTDRDLRLATSVLAPRPFAPGSRVDSVMVRDPETARPEDPVEDAARVMRERKIGCLPVIEAGRAVGIVTSIDLLDALLRMTGVGKPTGRIEVRLTDRPGELARLTGFFASRGVSVRSVLTYPDADDAVRTVLRIGSIETRPLADVLRADGFDVVWPARKPWPQ
ncbi:MAG TPA: CBS and ACT domain-containing protein [Thermoanaerobaculia bacterium]|nr:CBS and ACT domain-containing protein [Thermoanaerobaculia bacterium]